MISTVNSTAKAKGELMYPKLVKGLNTEIIILALEYNEDDTETFYGVVLSNKEFGGYPVGYVANFAECNYEDLNPSIQVTIQNDEE